MQPMGTESAQAHHRSTHSTMMSTPNLSRNLKGPEVDVLRTLWDQRPSMAKLFALGAATLVLIWAYLPNLRDLMTVWNDDPNYSHGYLVIPIALFVLWQQLSNPEPTNPEPKASAGVISAPWWGWIFLAAVLVLRAIAYERDSEWSENATLIPAIAALTWSFGSWPLLRRVWPAVAFLVFMLPLPQAVNSLLAMPLQSLAAASSCFLLQLTGMWVVQHGNVVNLTTSHGLERLDVALACNGLRMMMTMAATVTATIIVIPLPRWKRITLLLSIVPIALVSNMARIVATGWCYYLIMNPTYKHWAHDVSGWLMMPLALALVGLELSVLSWLVPKEDDDDRPFLPLLIMAKKDSDKDRSSDTKKHSGKAKSSNQDLGEI